MKTKSIISPSLILAAGLLLSTAASQAALYYHVSIDTSALNLPVNSANGPFSLDFQFNSGSTPGNNTAIISNFSFIGLGGIPFGPANLVGAGASGDLSLGTVTLNDTDPFNEFYQSFAAGTALEFDIHLTQNLDGVAPDSFSFAILDGSLLNIPTTGIGDSLLQLDINTASPIPVSGLNLGTGTGSYSGVTVTAVPEPSAALLGVLACGFGLLRRRRSA